MKSKEILKLEARLKLLDEKIAIINEMLKQSGDEI